ncbi:ATP synthase F0 subunit B [Streptomyces marincola]|uniref:ATP synthase F0 subunit B n=1 Tax=Streptomyces marincola TaxID=2878388 RepID=UPI001CF2A432|nr:ATP synthase F0 subunit B [Streptomyces marincola]UCM90706.1 cell division initiation protein [Streptomyces marincola]
MDVQQKLDEIVAAIRGAKSMPMSASCVINRSELLGRLEEVRRALPDSIAEAREVLGGREQVVAEARQEARRIVEAAHAERGSLVDGTEIVQRAQDEASRILAAARQEAEEVKAEADDYVDSKLANFEVVLGKTIGSVDRGRTKLLGPERGEPQELLAQADAYVEAQFGAIEAVLTKTLEAVGRGRQKLTGHRPIDELAEHVAAQEARDAGEGTGPGEGYFDPRAEQDTYDYLGVPQPRSVPQPPPPPQAPQAPAPAIAAADPAANGWAASPPSYAPGAQDGTQGAYDAQAGYAETAYGAAGYASGGYGAQDGYGPDGYGTAQPGYAADPRAQQGYGHQAPGTLEETSLFDTGMIDAEHLRRYQQGHS